MSKKAIILVGAMGFLAVLTVLALPSPTMALPNYAAATGQACGVCHVNPAGGGPRTAIGQAFEAIPTHTTDPAGAWAQVNATATPTNTPIPPTATPVPPTPTTAPPTATATTVAATPTPTTAAATATPVPTAATATPTAAAATPTMAPPTPTTAPPTPTVGPPPPPPPPPAPTATAAPPPAPTPAPAPPPPPPAPTAPPAPAPSITISSPMGDQIIAGNSVMVRISVMGLTLAPDAIGKANVPGQGHWHILLDGKLVQPVGTESFTLTGLTPGRHVITIELHNNDHSMLSPAVTRMVNVMVAGAPAPVGLPKTGDSGLPPWLALAGALAVALGFTIQLGARALFKRKA